MRAGETRPLPWVFVVVAMLVALALGRVGEGVDTGTARRRIGTALGLSITIATCALTSRLAWASALRELGLMAALLPAIGAIGAIDGDVGLAPGASAASSPRITPLLVTRIGIAVAAVALGGAALADVTLSTPTAASIAAGAIAVALFAAGACALVVSSLRRLELAVPPRALACAFAAVGGLAIAMLLALEDALEPDAAAALAAALASPTIVRLAGFHDAIVLARRSRRLLVLALYGAPLGLVGALLVSGHAGGATAGLLALFAVALTVGTAAGKLEEPFLPAKGRLLEALADARDAGRERESREAIAQAMMRLREACAVGLGPTAAPSPELWFLHPTRVITVNAAAYLVERRAELPADVFDVALGEPHGTLRTAVLRALEVRRADLRPLLAWLEQRDALFATVLAEGDQPDGLLVVPRAARTEEPSLEEAAAASRLAASFVAVAQATSAKVRHLAREHELKERNDALDEEIARLEHARDLDRSRHELAATRLARPATVGIYSAASRMAYDALERRIAQDAPVVVVARPGIDPVPYVARAHLAGPRRSGALVVVDATSSREHDVARWTDERTSPLALADRGLLLLLDGAALPRDVQTTIARAIAQRRPPWERPTPLDVNVALGTVAPLEQLLEEGRIAPELALRFEDGEPIVLPRLRDRPEDLHAIVADRLAREGLRVLGRPVGIDAGAYARLVELPFEGEDAELSTLVTFLVARAQRRGEDVVRAVDVDVPMLELSIREA